MKIEGGGGSGMSESAGNSTNFVLLSEGCVSYILSHTSPRDACTASSISRGFKCFANSDAVWERFLPSDYQDIISRSVSPVIYSSKKELYFRLCDSPVLIDDGNISFSLNKHNGKKCFMLGAKALSIAWQDTLIFWRWRSLPESRFSKVAELLAVCWLEIKGKFTTKMLSSETSYAAYLVYNIGAVSHGLDFPAKTWVRHIDGREEVEEVEEVEEEEDVGVSVVYLTPPKTGESVQHSVHRHRECVGRVPQRRADGWMEIELGKFYNEKMDGEVEMGFTETQELLWKSGLIIEGIDIRPIAKDGVRE
ncbi:putative F-box protein PP2-B12 [Cynara cardunculus var. scolymus]|uniref:putative F-box protein PP2-B12 n=1 Tax=Cynara cardunculus var. scolymus TaxID=59895 RepID=UPI000D62C15F|nr:putative F-box protein PP2-B12 [Cynara cardunculus var. scolymus]